MKALVFHKIRDVSVDNVDDPKIKDQTDVIIRVTSTAICGSDLHIYNMMIPQLSDQVLGHEFMGIVEEVGSEVKKIMKGDRVVVPFNIGCGSCFFCAMQIQSACEHSNPEMYGPDGGLLKEKGGGMYGYTDLYGHYDGGQAEYARVAWGDHNCRVVPENLTDDQVLFVTDIFPTGYTAIDWAQPKGGETVAIFGSGPVGLMAAKSAWLRGAKRVIVVDREQYRLDKAKQSTNSETILLKSPHDEDPIEEIREMTGGRGADIVVDAVGMEPDRSLGDRALSVVRLEKGSINAMRMCFDAARRGAHVSVMGVYGMPYDNFPVHQLFDKGLKVQMGQAQVHKNIDYLMDLVSQGKVKLDDIISHRLPLSEAAKGYDIFQKKEDNCVKVVLKPHGMAA